MRRRGLGMTLITLVSVILCEVVVFQSLQGHLNAGHLVLEASFTPDSKYILSGVFAVHCMCVLGGFIVIANACICTWTCMYLTEKGTNQRISYTVRCS